MSLSRHLVGLQIHRQRQASHFEAVQALEDEIATRKGISHRISTLS
jgi:hypothetical protein